MIETGAGPFTESRFDVGDFNRLIRPETADEYLKHFIGSTPVQSSGLGSASPRQPNSILGPGCIGATRVGNPLTTLISSGQ
jgi:hypothetical protein